MSRPDLPVQDLVRALEDLSRAQREIGAQLSRAMNLPRAGTAILRYLGRSGPVQTGCLAQHLRVDLSVASRQVSALVDLGLVGRTVDDDDRRARSIELTPAGRTASTEVDERIATALIATFSSWDPSEMSAAVAHVTAIARTLADSTATIATQQPKDQHS